MVQQPPSLLFLLPRSGPPSALLPSDPHQLVSSPCAVTTTAATGAVQCHLHPMFVISASTTRSSFSDMFLPSFPIPPSFLRPTKPTRLRRLVSALTYFYSSRHSFPPWASILTPDDIKSPANSTLTNFYWKSSQLQQLFWTTRFVRPVAPAIPKSLARSYSQQLQYRLGGFFRQDSTASTFGFCPRNFHPLMMQAQIIVGKPRKTCSMSAANRWSTPSAIEGPGVRSSKGIQCGLQPFICTHARIISQSPAFAHSLKVTTATNS